MKKLLLLLIVAFVIGVPAVSAQNCTVRHGDNLWKIARRYNVDFHRILEMNKHHLKNVDLIHPYQQIEIPYDAGTGNNNDQSLANHDNANSAEHAESNDQANAILQLVNKARQENGFAALKLDVTLNKVATVKAKDMGDNNYFSHDSPTYGSPFDLMHAFGVDYRSAGENIAAGQTSAQMVMDDWMHSSGHRANILNPNYTHLGVGYYNSGSQAPYWVQEFTQK